MTATLTDQDRLHLARALELAEGGRGRVSPNPLVGAVLVGADGVIGEGFHAAVGERHAEVAALEDCRARGNDPAGASLYVTLEPCAHHGRQPPCTDAIVAAGVARVVVGCDDPSERASGRGPGVLRDEGIEVAFAEGADAAEARLLVQPFRKRSRTGVPLVTHKAAVSVDGRTATLAGDSKWISGPESRRLVHEWRADSDAIAVGIGTVLADDPLLTARDVGAARQPTRVVFDSSARLPLDSKLVGSLDDARVMVVCGTDAPDGRTRALAAAGVDVVPVAATGAAAVTAALEHLGRREVTSLMLEGGATLAGAFLVAGAIDALRVFIAPVVLGGGRPMFEGPGTASIEEATRPLSSSSERVGEDVLISVRLREW
jgi:diaminohydroxyphosphoribosylaminopyrimidine deaminase / 5-amino-6-(5-phosphoribosylamino)uracil reductase